MTTPELQLLLQAVSSSAIAGGLIYTSGVFVFISQKMKFRRAIWHSFVLVGAGLHFAAVALGVVFG